MGNGKHGKSAICNLQYIDPIIQRMRLVLASASPRRASLLTSAGFTFETLVVDADERPRPDEAPPAYVRRLAGEKSARGLDVLSRLNQTVAEQEIVVLGADTAVVLDGDILGKPRDDEDARAMLRRLSGRRHEVVTGVSLRTVNHEMGLVEATSVWFARLAPDAIDWYVSTGEGRDKAGAYAIQGLASRLIPRIEGSYSNVVGLPVAAVADLLQELERVHPG
jgi:septum formation protein